MRFKPDDFVKVTAPNGNWRYGYITRTAEGAEHIEVCMHDEGDSRIEFEKRESSWRSYDVDWEEALSLAERRVLALVAQGKTNKEIASELGITPGTVRSHVRILYRSFNCADRVQLRVYGEAIARRFKHPA